MGHWRFRKTRKVAPGVRLNASKRGLSMTLGPRGLRYTISRKGRRHTTVGIPGSGLSYTRRSRGCIGCCLPALAMLDAAVASLL